MKRLEYEALLDAATRPGGWALFKRKTTEKLVQRGWFEPVTHAFYGGVFKITECGREALRHHINTLD